MNILEIDVDHQDRSVRLALRGELDISSAARVEGEVERALAGGGTELIVLDLRELTFMDSTGLRAIVRSHEAAQRLARRLAIVRGPGPVDRIFEIVGLGDRLDLVDEPPVLL